VESKLGPLGTSATNWPTEPASGDCEDSEFGGMRIGRGKPKYSEKICPSATLSTTNPTWPYQVSNPGRRGGKPATNRLSYGSAKLFVDPWNSAVSLISGYQNLNQKYAVTSTPSTFTQILCPQWVSKDGGRLKDIKKTDKERIRHRVSFWHVIFIFRKSFPTIPPHIEDDLLPDIRNVSLIRCDCATEISESVNMQAKLHLEAVGTTGQNTKGAFTGYVTMEAHLLQKYLIKTRFKDTVTDVAVGIAGWGLYRSRLGTRSRGPILSDINEYAH
jgi:hypothetical protein